MKVIIITSLYWITIFVVLDLFLEKFRTKLTFTFKKFKILEFMTLPFMKIKDYLPSVSRFNKSKITSLKLEYFQEYNTELCKAFLIHTIPIFFLLPLYFINFEFFIINFLIYFILNLPFIFIIYHNKLKIQKLLFRKKDRKTTNYYSEKIKKKELTDEEK